VAALGVAALVALLVHAGPARVADVLCRMRGGIAVAIVLEGLRIAAETWGARAMLGAARLPRRALARAQLVGYALCYVLPAGRAVAEACKVGLLSPYVSRARAVGVALANQAMALLAVGIASAGCVALIGSRCPRPLTMVLVVHAAVTLAAGGTLWVLSARRMPETGKRTALVSMLVSRALQAASVLAVVRAAAPGSGVLDACCVWGLHLLGASAGDVALAQVGFTDGALVLGAAAAHLDAVGALSIALGVRLAQMTWVVLGAGAACVLSPDGAHRSICIPSSTT
jgi:hypothetical protein